ncbi:MAG: ABC transporter ATP-binding protein [Pseudonocardiales bacterium]|nr:MAG: ABC transporter ATP-binding protein [Pseudonocardiales bacterium]
MTPTDLVVATDLTRVYGSGPGAVVAVRSVSCRVSPGARIALTGASGSGKTTLLHLLAGLDEPTTGEVSWPGLREDPPQRPRRLGVVFQGPSLVPPLDVVENVALPLLIAGVPDAVATGRAVEALTEVGITELATKLPEELSGGQAQRVAVARVLAMEPRLILADEPTGQLDAAHRDQVVDILLAVAERLAAGLVVCTHDERVAQRLAQRWRMRDGLLVRPTPEASTC